MPPMPCECGGTSPFSHTEDLPDAMCFSISPPSEDPEATSALMRSPVLRWMRLNSSLAEASLGHIQLQKVDKSNKEPTKLYEGMSTVSLPQSERST